MKEPRKLENLTGFEKEAYIICKGTLVPLLPEHKILDEIVNLMVDALVYEHQKLGS